MTGNILSFRDFTRKNKHFGLLKLRTCISNTKNQQCIDLLLALYKNAHLINSMLLVRNRITTPTVVGTLVSYFRVPEPSNELLNSFTWQALFFSILCYVISSWAWSIDPSLGLTTLLFNVSPIRRGWRLDLLVSKWWYGHLKASVNEIWRLFAKCHRGV